MEQVLLLRENIIKYFRRFDMFIIPALRFFAGFFIFSMIADIGFVMPMFEFLTEPPVSTLYLMTMGAITAFMSPVIIYLCVTFSLAVFLSAILEIAFAVTIFALLVLFFYVRLAPKESILMLWMFFAFYFRIPYIIPIVCGLYFGFTSIIPITIGVFAWSFTPTIISLIPAQIEAVTIATLDITELPRTFLEMFAILGEVLFADAGWLFTAFVFALVIVVVHFVSIQEINYASQISILLGAAICVISFVIIGAVTGDTSALLGVFLMSVPSVLICLVASFFDVVLDYRKSDRVSFEDDDNIYYVKIVPKVQMTEPEHETAENPRASKPQRPPRPDRSPDMTGRMPRPDRSPDMTGRPPRPDRSPDMTGRMPRPDRSPDMTGRPPRPERPEGQGAAPPRRNRPERQGPPPKDERPPRPETWSQQEPDQDNSGTRNRKKDL